MEEAPLLPRPIRISAVDMVLLHDEVYIQPASSDTSGLLLRNLACNYRIEENGPLWECRDLGESSQRMLITHPLNCRFEFAHTKRLAIRQAG